MYVVTGGAGFIGSNLVEGLNRSGENDILVVDEFSDVSQVQNLAGCRIADYQDKEDFLMSIERSGLPSTTSAVFHMGACSNTMAEDGRYVMKTNFDYSKKLLHACVDSSVPLIYASSAAVYGRGTSFAESEDHEYPLNAYAFSKQLFDSYVRKEVARISSQVVALRYFNVYGPREAHKASMASIVYQMFKQYSKHGRLRLFRGTGGYGDGEQRRDFISVDDIVSDDWTRSYSRQTAARPAPWLNDSKFWPAVGRIDNAFGDRQLVCQCPPVEAYAADTNEERP